MCRDVVDDDDDDGGVCGDFREYIINPERRKRKMMRGVEVVVCKIYRHTHTHTSLRKQTHTAPRPPRPPEQQQHHHHHPTAPPSPSSPPPHARRGIIPLPTGDATLYILPRR